MVRFPLSSTSFLNYYDVLFISRRTSSPRFFTFRKLLQLPCGHYSAMCRPPSPMTPVPTTRSICSHESTCFPSSSNLTTFPVFKLSANALAIFITINPPSKGNGTGLSSRTLSTNSLASVAKASSNLCQYSGCTSCLMPSLSASTTLLALGITLICNFPSVPVTSVQEVCNLSAVELHDCDAVVHVM
jgi:hypothetical protein